MRILPHHLREHEDLRDVVGTSPTDVALVPYVVGEEPYRNGSPFSLRRVFVIVRRGQLFAAADR